jgi:hypothetical protein
MTCILRAGGTKFDVDDFIDKSSLVVQSFWRKGEKRFEHSKSNEKTNEASGVRIVASEADFSELSRQIEDVIVFLRQNQEPIRELVSTFGIDDAVLDFGAEIYPPGWATFTFPAALLQLAGSVGVSLCLSVYPTEFDDELDA